MDLARESGDDFRREVIGTFARGKDSAVKIGGGAALGALIGGLAGGGKALRLARL